MVVVTCKGKQTGPDKLACVPRPVLIYLSVVLLPSVRIGIWLLGKKEKKKGMQVTVTEWRLTGDSWLLGFLSILVWALLGTRVGPTCT